MCAPHWRRVPRDLQKKVWAHYRPGQCDDRSPSEAWHEAADLAIAAVADKEADALDRRADELALTNDEDRSRCLASEATKYRKGAKAYRDSAERWRQRREGDKVNEVPSVESTPNGQSGPGLV